MAAKVTKKQKVKAKTSTKAVKKTATKTKTSAKKPAAKPLKKKTAAKAQPVKKTTKKPVAAKKAVAKKPVKKIVAKKPAAKKAAPKTVKKAVAKKLAPKAVKATAKKLAPVKPPKAVKVAAPKAEKKISTRKKKPTKMDKKVARTLVKIANAAKTGVAHGGIRSAAMAALKATVALSAANVNAQPPVGAVVAQAANTNQPTKEAKGEKPAFKAGDMVVYPAHGVGKVEGIEAHTVGGTEVKLFKITFDHERMTLKVPMQRATGSGLRQLSNKETMKNVFETMKGRPRIRRVMWSRRAQEYEQKINSGDPVAIAEVLRDLRRNAESGEQSYSERQIFNNALERLAREVAAIDKVPQEKAVEKLHNLLVRSKAAATPIISNDDEAEDAA